MNNQPLISIVCICKDNQQELLATVISILRQSADALGKTEIIVIDGSQELVEIQSIRNSLANRLRSGIDTHLHGSDAGIYDAMNKGLAAANGEWVIFLNSGDCFYSERVLSRIIEIIHEHGHLADCMYGLSVRHFRDGSRSLHHAHPMNYGKWLLGRCSIPHQATLARRERMAAIGGFRLGDGMAADQLLLLAVCGNAKPFVVWEILTLNDGEGVSQRAKRIGFSRRMLTRARELHLITNAQFVAFLFVSHLLVIAELAIRSVSKMPVRQDKRHSEAKVEEMSAREK